MEPQLFAVVDANDHDIVYCLGVDTGEGAFTFRRDPTTNQSIFGSSSSMYSAFTRASQMVRSYGRFDLVIYGSTVDEVKEYQEGVCLVCDNQRKVSVDLRDFMAPEHAQELEGLDDTIPCPECTDEHGKVRSGVN